MMERPGRCASGGKSAMFTWNRRDTYWREACIRGTTWGLVLGLHGLLLMALLHLKGLRPQTTDTPETAATTMLLQLLRMPTTFRATQPPILRLPARRTRQPSRATPTSRSLPAARLISAEATTMTRPSHAPDVFAVPAPSSSIYDAYHPGGFPEALRQARHGAQIRLPGSDVPIVKGLPLKAVVSVRDVVRALTHASFCSAELSGMRHQSLSLQDMDRLLEADRCGAHADNSPAVHAAIERATKEAARQAFPGNRRVQGRLRKLACGSRLASTFGRPFRSLSAS
ncbi:MAG: hypothetical protein ABI389_16090 [Rhodanobacter sp.]